MYSVADGRFLPDRYIEGTCPNCGFESARGDQCDNCTKQLDPIDLINPRSTVSGSTDLELRETKHLYLRQSALKGDLEAWIDGKTNWPVLSTSIAKKWLNDGDGLQDRGITRDLHWGIPVKRGDQPWPGMEGKVFYVWFDAPIGYLGSFKALCARRGLDMDHYLKSDSPTELHHFIGKDISYFHTLFWPAVLHGSGFRRPTAVHVHGFLTINGQKMSKSRGTFITARRYLEHLPAEPLRYYFAAKLGAGVDDIDLSLEDFTARVNSDLVGKLVNIASRCAGFVARSGGRLATDLPEPELHAEFAAAAPRIAALYEARDYSQAMREIMLLADRANQYVDARKPWALARDPQQAQAALAVATQGINLFRVLMLYLAPVLPQMACKAAAFLGTPLARWSEADTPLLGSELAAYEPLATRLEPKAVAALVAQPDTTAATAPATAAAPVKATAPVAATAPAPITAAAATSTEPATIGIDDFTKVQLRIAEVLAASTVEGSDKLLKLTLGLGDSQRTVFSGIRKSYSPESLIGKRVVLVANLAPRKMRFGVSEGMVLCATDENDRVFLLTADEGAAGGMPIS